MVLLTIKIIDSATGANLVKTYDIPLQALQCTPPQVPNPVTGKCEVACTPPQIYNAYTGRCETPEIKCTPPQVYNPITGRCENPTPQCTYPQVWNPVTGKCEAPATQCTPPQVLNPVTGKCETPPPPTITAKIIKIATLRNAFRTQEIPILITATCTDPPSVVNGEDSALLIDGKVVERKTVIDGSASFLYTFKEAGLHSIRVVIPRSSGCDAEGSNSVQIDISAEVPSTLERLRIEKEAQRVITEQIEAERKKVRESFSVATVTA